VPVHASRQRAESVLVINGLCFRTFKEDKPLRGNRRMWSVFHRAASVDRYRVLTDRNCDTLNRISDALLKANLRGPRHTRIYLLAHDAHRSLPMMDLGQNRLTALDLVLVDGLIQPRSSWPCPSQTSSKPHSRCKLATGVVE
jgi:hypothetical protein